MRGHAVKRIILGIIAALLLFCAGVVAQPVLYNPYDWGGYVDVQLPPSPCGDLNTYSVSIGPGPARDVALVLYMCWDGRFIVREHLLIP